MRFSLESYRHLMERARRSGFETAPFDGQPHRGRTLLLRHDVDYSLELAVSLARVNSELGVSGTFFILTRGHAYNAMAKKSFERLGQLVELGQRLGVHVAGGTDEIAVDHSLIAAAFPVEKVFSWHNPSPQVMRQYRDHETLGGLINVYSRRFLDDALYRSDSNFGHTYEEIEGAFDAGRDVVHLLLHPINWVAGGDSMLDVFENAWPYLLREAEAEARTNRVYIEHFPEGMPDSLLTEFSRRWRKAAG